MVTSVLLDTFPLIFSWLSSFSGMENGRTGTLPGYKAKRKLQHSKDFLLINSAHWTETHQAKCSFALRAGPPVFI